MDSSSYLTSLDALKGTFRGIDESTTIIEHVQSCISVPTTRILEIGCGDGRFVQRLNQALTKNGTTITITAIDPLTESLQRTRQEIQKVTVHHTTFEQFYTDEIYDSINVRHVLYYLDNPKEQLARMINFLKPGGKLILTLWSQKCDLYTLYQTYATQKYGITPDPILTAEGVQEYLTKKYGETYISSTYVTTDIDTTPWYNSAETLRHVHTIIRREPEEDHRSDDFLQFQQIFSYAHLNNKRIIGVVVYQKPLESYE